MVQRAGLTIGAQLPAYSSASYNVIIIGAGWHGIAAAKTYLEINPEVSLMIIDADSSVGGTWSAARIYPGLCADTPSGAFEFADLSMEEALGIPLWSDLTGDVVHEYLEKYARKHTILERCKLDTEVVRVARSGCGWNIAVRPTGSESSITEHLQCDKLIVATGMTSKPVMPNIDTSAFKGKIFHSRDFGQCHGYLTSDAVQNVTVVGGNKSSVEVARLCALAGKTVTWLIRPEGHGPGIMLDARRDGKHISQLGYARWTSILKPSIYMARNWWYYFLHSGRNWLGFWLTEWFWRKQMQINTQRRYTKSRNGEMLKPFSESLFWVTGISVVHDSDKEFMGLVDEEKLVHVHQASISSISETAVKLSTGEKVSSDAIVFCTGWSVGCDSLFDPSEGAELGVSAPLEGLSEEYIAYWQKLDAEAEKFVLESYPLLKTAPKAWTVLSSRPVPYRCFRTIAPTSLAAKHDRSLIFLGMLGNSQVPSYAEVSALWGVAYLENLLPDGSCDGLLGCEEGMDRDVANMTTFMAKRYPNKYHPLATVEIQSYIDITMRDLGLRTDRKRVRREAEDGFLGIRGWAREWFEAYGAGDYKGLVQEYLDARAAGSEDQKNV